jgi:uroporphyrinogen III methyltransferase/synthase
VLLARANRGREVLAEMLSAAGAVVEQAVVYQSRDVAQPNEAVAKALTAGRIDWMTVTSTAIARSLIAMFGEQLLKSRLVAISPLTADILAKEGNLPSVVAQTYTTDGIVFAILSAQPRKP